MWSAGRVQRVSVACYDSEDDEGSLEGGQTGGSHRVFEASSCRPRNDSRLQFASAELTTTRALRRYMLAGDDKQDPIVGPLLVEDVRTQIEKERSEAEREKRRDELLS